MAYLAANRRTSLARSMWSTPRTFDALTRPSLLRYSPTSGSTKTALPCWPGSARQQRSSVVRCSLHSGHYGPSCHRGAVAEKATNRATSRVFVDLGLVESNSVGLTAAETVRAPGTIDAWVLSGASRDGPGTPSGVAIRTQAEQPRNFGHEPDTEPHKEKQVSGLRR